ncbi:AbrB/MazE/SpoVT family DNA-binding domain-containing protein [Halegenticoccus soli]|uniref:AbrB/MazE/SpoVT family DNA-binding domain-containing protein n=1 Tax=Halegenticoccus soli TaxID=1985678 RepID=UPI0018EA7F21|nr:AbrB/MazE/SpoVT family DNA-binding domain-containing protein [Halegenticoccus soli]
MTVDDRGRITLPKHIRDRLQLGEGDDLDINLEEGEIHLRPNRPQFTPISSNKDEWGEEAFLDVGEAMFGDLEDDNGR